MKGANKKQKKRKDFNKNKTKTDQKKSLECVTTLSF